MAADPAELVETLTRQMQSIGIDVSQGPAPEQLIEAYRERAETLRELASTVRYLYEDEVQLDEKAAKKQTRSRPAA